MSANRAAKTVEASKDERKEAKERMVSVRARRTDEERETEKKKAKERMADVRARKANEEIEVERKVTNETIDAARARKKYEEIKEAKEKRVAVITLKIEQIKGKKKKCPKKSVANSNHEKVEKVKRFNEHKLIEMERENPGMKKEKSNLETKLKIAQNDRKQKRRGLKKKLSAKLVHPRPERQLCRYEQIREDNVRERKEAMAKCNFFEDLHTTKQNIGFYSKKDCEQKGRKKIQ